MQVTKARQQVVSTSLAMVEVQLIDLCQRCWGERGRIKLLRMARMRLSLASSRTRDSFDTLYSMFTRSFRSVVITTKRPTQVLSEVGPFSSCLSFTLVASTE